MGPLCVVRPRRDETIRLRHETIFAATRRNRETVNR